MGGNPQLQVFLPGIVMSSKICNLPTIEVGQDDIALFVKTFWKFQMNGFLNRVGVNFHLLLIKGSIDGSGVGI